MSRAFATIVEKTTESDVIFVKCDDGHVYAHEEEDYLENLQVGDWIYPRDWRLQK